MRRLLELSSLTLFPIALGLFGAAELHGAANADIAEIHVQTDLVVWHPTGDADGYRLSVAGPWGVTDATFSAGEKPYLKLHDAAGEPLEDGSYSWQLEARPVVDPEIADLLEEARQSGDEQIVIELDKAGLLPRGGLQFGHLTIAQGQFVLPDVVEEADPSNGLLQSPARGAQGFAPHKDFPILDDLIVRGSACVGQDCVDGESFGYSTVRLKENNLRIEFVDTSASASFPSNDWQLTANSVNNGGLAMFAIDDLSHGRTPFTVEAGAPNHALYTTRDGDIGFGTNAPAVELHVVDGDTPTLRLEQNGSSGFTAQTFDVAGNESNFFVRDVTNGSTLPFRIKPGAPQNALFIGPDGNIGLDTDDPDNDLHVVGGVVISDVDRNRIPYQALEIQASDDQKAKMLFDDGDAWVIGGGKENRFIIQETTDGAEFTLEASGDLTIAGTLTESSDVHAKENFAGVDAGEILRRVADLPITTWSYKADSGQSRHMGPMAQDFFAAFGLGASRLGLAPRDLAAVALAAIQGLNQELELERAHSEAQAEVIERLGARLGMLESRVP